MRQMHRILLHISRKHYINRDNLEQRQSRTMVIKYWVAQETT